MLEEMLELQKKIEDGKDELIPQYNKLLRELIAQDADFDMIFHLFEDEIENYVDSTCKIRYSYRDTYL